MMDTGTAIRHGRGRLVVLTLALVALLAACDWPMFGYDMSHTRYNPTEKAIGIGNVASLKTAWTGVINPGGPSFNLFFSSPSVAKGVVYVGSVDHKLYAFDEAGATGCSGSPKTCAPLWTATTGGIIQSSPAIANGVAYVTSDDDKFYAFDASGVKNCSGVPKSCAPLWTAAGGGAGSPTVANGAVYVGSGNGTLSAFDTAGTRNCSGTPKTCAPLWTASIGAWNGSSPAVANGVVYVGGNSGALHAFDAAGVESCAGIPKKCAPLWTGTTGGSSAASPSVANGVVYIATANINLGLSGMYAFDAAGVKNCSGIPKTCTPLWIGITKGSSGASPAVANGMVYVGSDEGKLYAFDAAGGPSCFGIYCVPQWSTKYGTTGSGRISSPAVANGLVYVGSEDGNVYAYDAAGNASCWRT